MKLNTKLPFIGITDAEDVVFEFSIGGNSFSIQGKKIDDVWKFTRGKFYTFNKNLEITANIKGNYRTFYSYDVPDNTEFFIVGEITGLPFVQTSKNSNYKSINSSAEREEYRIRTTENCVKVYNSFEECVLF